MLINFYPWRLFFHYSSGKINHLTFFLLQLQMKLLYFIYILIVFTHNIVFESFFNLLEKSYVTLVSLMYITIFKWKTKQSTLQVFFQFATSNNLEFLKDKFKAHFLFEGGKYPNSVFVIFICYLSPLKHPCLKIPFSFGRIDRTGLTQGEEKGPQAATTVASPYLHLRECIQEYSSTEVQGELMKLEVVEADLEFLRELLLELASLGVTLFFWLDLALTESLGSNTTVMDSILVTVQRLLCLVGWNLVALSSSSSQLDTSMKGHQRKALLKPARNLRSGPQGESYVFKRKFLSTATESPL